MERDFWRRDQQQRDLRDARTMRAVAEQLEQLAAGDRVLGLDRSAAVLEAAASNIRARPLAQMQETDIALVEAVVAATRRIGDRLEADVLLGVIAVVLGRPPTERELELAKHASENEAARLQT